MRNHAQICSFNCGFLMDSERLGIYLLATFAMYLFLIITIMSRRNTRHLGVSWGKRLYEFCIALRYVCCIILEHLFLRIPLERCFLLYNLVRGWFGLKPRLNAIQTKQLFFVIVQFCSD